jgi:hypothetical protein
MTEINCPKCGTAFKVDETSYAEILKQVRNQEFDDELDKRIALETKGKEGAIETAIAKTRLEMQQKITDKDTKIAALQSNINSSEMEKELAVTKAVTIIEKERAELASDLKIKESSHEATISAIKEGHQSELKIKDDLIERYKDLKAKLSTKMVGETLEQHCEIEFERLRSVAFQNAHFGKDNDASQGTKGDYIFREHDSNGTEITSIMFEMKNENEETENKKKNEEFLKKLDSDRNTKNCEYAVLVSLLEADSDLYNQGIVDMSHAYPKMYVIRPQFFIPMISLLRNASESILEYKSELALVRAQTIDVTNFEEKMNDFKAGFGKNYINASDQFNKAIKSIDDSIKDLEKTKAELLKSSNNLRLANNKLENLTIRRLTYGNDTMKAEFSKAKDNT